MLATTSVVFAQIDPPCMIPGATLCDNLDAYTPGDALGPGASWWSTWDGIEGTSEDGTISTDYAYSGANSALIPEGGTTDVILKLGEIASGKQRLEWQMYIPSGKSGYYNIQDTEVPGVLWNLEVYLGDLTEGTGEFAVIAPGTTFSYPVNQWFKIEHVIDLDANTIEIYIDGVLALSDAFTGKLGSIDFYSFSANNRFYLDDVLFEEVIPVEPCAIPGAIYCDNIDTYAVGDYVGPYADWWSTWDGVEGGTEDGIVSDDYAFSGDNSVLIPGGGVTDVILKLGDKSSGNYQLEWQMYIPSGKSGYYNIQDTEVPGVLWDLELYFGDITEGTGEFTVPAAGPTFSYPVDQWFLVKHLINLDANTIEVWVNGVMVLSDAYIGNLGGVDFYSASGTNGCYLDDIYYTEALAPEPCAIPGAVFCDNIDTYTAGEYVGPFAEWWSTWDGVEGGTEDGIVSNDFSVSGENSVLIPEGGTADVILKLGNISEGKYRLEWQMYIPSGKYAYYNIQDTEVPGVLWNLELYFGDVTEGVGEFTVPVDGPTFDYPVDEWFLVEHIIDMDANTIDVHIAGVLVFSGEYIGNMGSIDYYSIGANNRCYLDDILLIEEAGGTPSIYYIDADDDTYGNPAVSIIVDGPAPVGYVADNTDCDDTNDAIYPGAPEVLNGLDDNCNNLIDEGIAINEISSTLYMNIFPVASNGNFTIEMINTSLQNTTVLNIYNNAGQIVYTESIASASGKIVKTINISSQASGIYQVQLISGSDLLNKQIVIQK